MKRKEKKIQDSEEDLLISGYTWAVSENYFPTLLSSYFRGIQKSTYRVTKGGPLPFSFDILSSAFKYGNRCFTKYPEGMPDYFKQAFPAGMSYERTFTFEDGGVATASGHIRWWLVWDWDNNF